MSRRVTLPVAAAIGAASLAHQAAAEARPARANQGWQTFRAGLGAGIGASDLRIDGKPASTLGHALALSGEAGYTRSLVGALGAVAITSLGTWPDGWADLAGEDRYRVDLAVGAALRLPYGRSAKPVRFFGSITVGPTISWIDAPVHVGIAEQFSPGLGLNGGVRAGVDLPVTGAHGVFVSAGAVTHATWLTHRTYVLRSPTAAMEKYRIFDVHGFVSTGYVWER
jgi:hypothetical protein